MHITPESPVPEVVSALLADPAAVFAQMSRQALWDLAQKAIDTRTQRTEPELLAELRRVVNTLPTAEPATQVILYTTQAWTDGIYWDTKEVFVLHGDDHPQTSWDLTAHGDLNELLTDHSRLHGLGTSHMLTADLTTDELTVSWA